MMICPRCGLPTSSGATAYAGDMCRCQWGTPNVIHNITDKERDLSKLLQNATQRINDLEAEVFEQARIVGMSTDREYALAGKIAQQEKALKLALKALEYVIARDYDFAETANPVGNSITAIRKVLGETK